MKREFPFLTHSHFSSCKTLHSVGRKLTVVKAALSLCDAGITSFPPTCLLGRDISGGFAESEPGRAVEAVTGSASLRAGTVQAWTCPARSG